MIQVKNKQDKDQPNLSSSCSATPPSPAPAAPKRQIKKGGSIAARVRPKSRQRQEGSKGGIQDIEEGPETSIAEEEGEDKSDGSIHTNSILSSSSQHHDHDHTGDKGLITQSNDFLESHQLEEETDYRR